jgi:hypothetical protein
MVVLGFKGTSPTASRSPLSTRVEREQSLLHVRRSWRGATDMVPLVRIGLR